MLATLVITAIGTALWLSAPGAAGTVPSQPATTQKEDAETKRATGSEAERRTPESSGQEYAGVSRDPEPSLSLRYKPYDRSPADYGVDGLDWLKFGLEYRVRYEHIDNAYRKTFKPNDDLVLMRSRVKIGIEEILDPFRFTLEFQDSREMGSDFPETTANVDEADFLQAYAELFFPAAFGSAPLRIQAGRMTLNYGRGRLIARNRFRNTVNAHDGFRVQLGDKKSRWQLDLFGVQPVDRLFRKPSHGDDEQWFFGAVGAWRGWDRVTIEPYYLLLLTQREDPTVADRRLQTIGVHAFGKIGTSHFDYDVEAAYQFGTNGRLEHDAFALHGEIGYTFTSHPWKPRLVLQYDYGSGDRNPTDGRSGTFNDLFPRRRAQYGPLAYFAWGNLNSPGLLVVMKPTKTTTVDFRYRAAWLARDSDSWRGIVRDPSGASGDFVGQEFDVRCRYSITEHAELLIGYSHFFAGEFVDRAGPGGDTDYFYVQTTFRF
jgi:Alginate export